MWSWCWPCSAAGTSAAPRSGPWRWLAGSGWPAGPRVTCWERPRQPKSNNDVSPPPPEPGTHVELVLALFSVAAASAAPMLASVRVPGASSLPGWGRPSTSLAAEPCATGRPGKSPTLTGALCFRILCERHSNPVQGNSALHMCGTAQACASLLACAGVSRAPASSCRRSSAAERSQHACVKPLRSPHTLHSRPRALSTHLPAIRFCTHMPAGLASSYRLPC